MMSLLDIHLILKLHYLLLKVKVLQLQMLLVKRQKQLKNQKILLEDFQEYLSYLKLDDQKILQYLHLLMVSFHLVSH
eukprot:NODE_390_length_1709_cov_253.493976_g309_i0.p2 GENE.NODE_390_length_1709_cov_253.493976_g309_i0~~NODE_390_length_1709_cov_253.493976_g309_i0.p2  ORF type:complete len:77 (-),score=3.52 NODE_390_length_1709_cov_253.493976_g309_i0:668-898(-)